MFSYLANKIGSYISNQVNNYYKCWEQIASSNLYMLRVTSIISALLILLLLLYACIAGATMHALQVYAIGFLFHVLHAILICRYAHCIKWRTRLIRLICTLYMLSLIVLVVYSAAVANQCESGIIFAPMLISLSVAFILPLWQNMTVVTLATIVFVVLSYDNKVAMDFRLDLTMGIIVWVLCLTTNAVAWDMRIRELCLRYDLVRLSSRDSLTGLMNKCTAEAAASAYLATKEECAMAALFVIDMDQFKEINDHMGHKAGDEALEMFGNLLLKLFRSQDIVGRIGGDEFVALMKNTGDQKLIKRRAALICDTVRSQPLNSAGFSLTCSIGIAISPLHGANYDALFSKADEQLYHIKRSGKNGYRVAQ